MHRPHFGYAVLLFHTGALAVLRRQHVRLGAVCLAHRQRHMCPHDYPMGNFLMACCQQIGWLLFVVRYCSFIWRRPCGYATWSTCPVIWTYVDRSPPTASAILSSRWVSDSNRTSATASDSGSSARSRKRTSSTCSWYNRRCRSTWIRPSSSRRSCRTRTVKAGETQAGEEELWC